MILFYELSGYPVSFIESQLSFSGTIIKSHFSAMNAVELNYYLIWVIIDYGFMLGFTLIYFNLGLTLARKFEETSGWRKSGYIGALFGLLYFLCDAVENMFIFLMLTDISGFPNVLAVIHSWFAVLKFIFNFSSGYWLIHVSVVLSIRRKP